MNSPSLKELQSVKFNLEQLQMKVDNHIKERLSAEGYVYADTYRGWVSEYNNIVSNYNNFTSTKMPNVNISDYELSGSQKTVRQDAANTFLQVICKFLEMVTGDIKNNQLKDGPIPLHQMRVCFKLGMDRCPLNPNEEKNKVFIAMPFSDKYKDSYEYGIKIALEQAGVKYYRADSEINNKDIMCKICFELQTCGKAIVNISGYNPNVMLELGLAYGLGKKVIVIKDKETTDISDLGSIEYIEYAHACELQQKLRSIFS